MPLLVGAVSDLVLSREDLRELTGYRLPSKQIEALRAMGVRHYVGPDGHPRVARAWLEGAAPQEEYSVHPVQTRRAG